MVGAALGVPVLVGEAVVGSVVLVLDAPQAATIKRAPANPMIGRTPAGYGVAGPWYTGRSAPGDGQRALHAELVVAIQLAHERVVAGCERYG